MVLIELLYSVLFYHYPSVKVSVTLVLSCLLVDQKELELHRLRSNVRFPKLSFSFFFSSLLLLMPVALKSKEPCVLVEINNQMRREITKHVFIAIVW